MHKYKYLHLHTHTYEHIRTPGFTYTYTQVAFTCFKQSQLYRKAWGGGCAKLQLSNKITFHNHQWYHTKRLWKF